MWERPPTVPSCPTDLAQRGRLGGLVRVGALRGRDLASHHLGLLLLAACERYIALELGETQIATHLLLDEMRELEGAALCEMHAVIRPEPLHLARHVRTVGAEAPRFVGEAIPRVDIFGAVDESLLAEHLIHHFGVGALIWTPHDRQTDPVHRDIGCPQLLDDGLDP